MVGGATLTRLLGTSAWYAPGASVSFLVDSILNDQKKIIPSSVYLDGEYNEKDICIGVPVIIGKDGVEKIIELDLNSISELNKKYDIIISNPPYLHPSESNELDKNVRHELLYGLEGLRSVMDYSEDKREYIYKKNIVDPDSKIQNNKK